MATHTSYFKLKTQFNKLFKVCDQFIKDHPGAVLEYDEMMEDDPTLGFVYDDGIVRAHTVFVLKRTKAKP